MAPVLRVLDPRSLPLELATTPVVVEVRTSSELAVRIAGGARDAEGWWARAHGADDVILAAAPFLARSRRCSRPAPRPARTAPLSRGRRHGRSRCAPPVASAAPDGRGDRHRSGRSPGRAPRRTTATPTNAGSCRGPWRRAGDEARSGQAAELAEGGGRRFGRVRVPPPLLADPVIEASSG